MYTLKKAKNDYLNIMSSNACFWLKKTKKKNNFFEDYKKELLMWS